MASAKRIEWNGQQIIVRTEGDESMLLRQRIALNLDGGAVNFSVTSHASGTRQSASSDDPGAVAFARRLDRIQRNVELIDRPPLPEPEREPVEDEG